METPKEYYYTYYSYEEWGRGYFGSRKCYCLPEKDTKYLGSSKDKTFKPKYKIILKDDYATREEALADEIILQQYYKVVENPHFANKAYQTSTKFYCSLRGEESPMYGKTGINHPAYGRECTPEVREKLKKNKLGKNNPQYGKSPSQETRNKMSDANSGEKCYWYGKSHTQSSKEKMRDAKLGDKNVNCKIWKLTFDDGREIIIRGLSVWAEQNGYRHQGIRLFYQGLRNRYKDIVKVEQIS